MQQMLYCLLEACNAYRGTCFWGCVLFCAPKLGLLHTVCKRPGSLCRIASS